MEKANYIEKDCVFKHEGKSFVAGGAIVTPHCLVGYLAKDGIIQDWHGKFLGVYAITATWKINSYISNVMHQVIASVNGVKYTGRSCGVGMIFKGKRIRHPNNKRKGR